MRGSMQKRLLHAASHAFVAYRVDGIKMPNYSEWLGTASAVALANTCHPGNGWQFLPCCWLTRHKSVGGEKWFFAISRELRPL